ncbi:PREDICTED: glycoprotein Xg isoform X4 [Chinchilla lanigera]|uniref:glycoprotein Xg isoform X4 n=1 Tax=Chinchilla lanigera TaxID=34839 RepID=UPI0006988752|nr:PREDICTED: glycoprotein Xg isoform X4 [Chinchilla lanigera]
MEARWELPCLTLLCLLTLAPGQRDFDLADALDDPEPTKKPPSALFPEPKLPSQPKPGNSGGGGGHPSDGIGGHQKPKPRPPAEGAGGAGGGGAGGGGGGAAGGGAGAGSSSSDYNSEGDTNGNRIARIVSPIVSVVVVTLLGAGVSFFKSGRRGNCLRTSEAENV